MTQQQQAFPVVVIGAGMAGLSAAAHLAARGLQQLVLEADQLWPGGRLAGGADDTFTYDGQTWRFPAEHGVHAIWNNYENLHALLERFADVTLQPSPGEEWINRWGREVRMLEAGNAIRSPWLPAPFHHLQLLFHPGIWATITPLDFLSLPGVLFSILMTVGLDPFAEETALDGLTLDDFFRGWTPNLRATFTGLAVNLLAAPAGQISLTGFIAALRFYTMLRRDAWVLRYLPDNPHHSLIQPLIDHITAKGGALQPGMKVLRLEPHGTHWQLIARDNRLGITHTIDAANVIMAVQPTAAQRLLMASPALRPQAEQIIFPDAVQNASVRLWFDASPRPGPPGGMLTGDFLPDNFFWLHRLYDDFRLWHEQTGGSAIEMHLYAEPDVLYRPANVLLIQCLDEVQRIYPALKGHYVHGAVRLNTRDHTRLRIPDAASLHVQTPWANLYAAGDWIGYPTPALWLERATTTGIAAANAVLHTHGLQPYPIHQPQPAEPLARGLESIVKVLRHTVGRGILKVGRALAHRR